MATEQFGSAGGKDALDTALEHKKEQGFRLPVDLEPANYISAALVPSHNIQVETPALPGVSYLVEAMVQITVDLDASPHSCMISSLLGEFEILGVTLPLLIIPTFSLPLGILEEVYSISDPLIDLATIIMLSSTLGSTSTISAIASPSASAHFLIASPLETSTIPPTVTVQLPILSATLPVPLLKTSLPEVMGIPTVQATLFFTAAVPIVAS